ncbi:TonB-dependent receptor [candidate division KSB1 bacterium]|nr:TonB-dependent receptor [candidate division KSB1 bacterium]
MLFSVKDSALVTGTVTNAQGNFQLSKILPGKYYLAIHFIGYKSEQTGAIEVIPPKLDHDLGMMVLAPATLSMESVVVEAERAAISYQIDKKVINVSQQHTAISGTAVDVLENVPSITVDIEGNVSLRGSGSFTVLIDGRPTILEPSEALQQIPASNIENIEIITNPSAKHNPEGTAGIVNVIMKKSRRYGSSAIVNANAGLNDKYGGDMRMEYKGRQYRATLGIDNGKKSYSGDDQEKNQTTNAGLTSFVNSAGDTRRGRNALGLRAELQLKLSPKNFLSLGGRYRDRDRENNSDLNFDGWSAPEEQRLRYTSITDRERSGDSHELNMSYQRLFNKNGHELSGELNFEQDDSYEETSHELLTEGQALISGQRATESGPEKEFQARLDYVLPFSDKHKFEAGYQNELERSKENTELYEYDSALREYVFRSQFSNSIQYNSAEHALYAIYAGAWKHFGFQGGMRGEYTYRTVEFQQEFFKIDRWDYFPTIHTSYAFSAGRQLMASYTRRIDRPTGSQLEPFETRVDAYTVRVGNPSLRPEYIDSYEAGFQSLFGKTQLSLEAYYRVNYDKIEQVRSVYDNNVALYSLANVGTDYSLGGELLLDLDLFKSWGINLMGNVYHYRIEGALSGEPFSRNSMNWSTRLHNAIKIGKSTQIQISGRYHSPTISSQERREDIFIADAAVKQEFFNNKFSATLQIRDLLRSRKDEYIAQGADFYSYRYSTRESPIIMLNLRYTYNQKKSDRKLEIGEDDDEEVEF